MTEYPPPEGESAPVAPPASPSGPSPASSNVSLAEPQRQSLLAIIFLAARTIRQIGIVQIVIAGGFLISRSPSLLVLIGVVLAMGVIFLAVATLRWWRYTFMVDGGELRVDRGVLSRDTLTVPLDRVQSVSIEQKFLHRLVKLVQVSLDTAGTSNAEFTFDAVERDVGLELQRVAADFRSETDATTAVDNDPLGDPPAPTPPFEEQTILKHSPARLVRLGLSRVPFSGLAFLAPLFAFGDDIVERVPFDAPDLEVDVGLMLLWFVPLVIVAVAVFGLILNLIGTFLRDWDLRITQTESGLRREAGLLSTTSVASNVSRVQSVETRQGLLQRLFGLQHITLHNIGEGDFLVPGCTAEEIATIRKAGLEEMAGVEDLDRRTSTAEIFKNARNAAIFFSALTFALFFVVGFWAFFALVPIPVVWWGSSRSVRLRRWGIDGDSIAIRNELLEWRTHEALLHKANGVAIRQSYFERSRGLATVDVRLAGGILSGSISIGMIPYEEATAVRDHVLFIVETNRRVFM